VEIDTWPHLAPYCEIEAETEQVVKKVASKLNFNWDQAIFAGTGAIYDREYGIFPDDLEDLSRLTFDSDNPFTKTNE
jgi:hypothetical protein